MNTGVLDHCPQCKSDLKKARTLLDGEALSFCPKCNFPLRLIANKYRLERVLGKGGFGTVYLARHIRLLQDAERVVKVLPPEVFKAPGMKERFFREVQLTSILSQRDEHIVRVYDDFGELPDLGHFYVMEYLQGTSLDELVANPGRLPSLEFCYHIFRQLCDTMQMAHDNDVVHRDLKPENIFLIHRKKDKNFLKVLDFGIARPMNQDDVKRTGLTQGALGTPFYMAPEQCLNREVDARTDLYAIGVILYEMLVGYTPFDPRLRNKPLGSAVEILMDTVNEPPPSPLKYRSARVDERIERFLLKALAKAPQDRYQSAREMRDAFDKIHRPMSLNSVWTMDRFDEPESGKVPIRVDDMADFVSETQFGDSQELLTPLPDSKSLKNAEDSKIATLPTGLLETGEEEDPALEETMLPLEPMRQQAKSLVRSDILARSEYASRPSSPARRRTEASDELVTPVVSSPVSAPIEVKHPTPVPVSSIPPSGVVVTQAASEDVIPPSGSIPASDQIPTSGAIPASGSIPVSRRGTAPRSMSPSYKQSNPYNAQFVFKEKEPEPSRSGLWIGVVVALLLVVGWVFAWSRMLDRNQVAKAPQTRRVLPSRPRPWSVSELRNNAFLRVQKRFDTLSAQLVDGALARCRTKLPASKSGTWVMRWKVLPTGRVTAVKGSPQEGFSEEFRRCLRIEIRRWPFATFSAKAGSLDFHRSFVIKSSSRSKVRRAPRRKVAARAYRPVAGCPSPPANKKWIRLDFQPSNKRFSIFLGNRLWKRGVRRRSCIPIGNATSIRIEAAGFDSCTFALIWAHHRLRVKMKKLNDDDIAVGGKYCLK